MLVVRILDWGLLEVIVVLLTMIMTRLHCLVHNYLKSALLQLDYCSTLVPRHLWQLGYGFAAGGGFDFVDDDAVVGVVDEFAVVGLKAMVMGYN